MPYLLGDITLPQPVSFTRRQVETSASNMTLDGRTKKDITNRKEEYILVFTLLTQAEVTSILGEFDLKTTRNFQVTESNLTISATPVHIEIASRNYNTKGGDYREDITLALTEVS